MEAHSPLGGSSAERWMHCPGSVQLLKFLALPEVTEEPDYRRDGTTAHAAAAWALENAADAWELVGQEFGGQTVSADMTKGIQVYLDECRAVTPEGAQVFLEYHMHAPDFHPQAYSTLDFAAYKDGIVRLRDYKNGFLEVECRDNPQLLYYAFLLLRHPDLADCHYVDMGIVQPNSFSPTGPVKTWGLAADKVREWGETVLLPAMNATEFDHTLDPGRWCRWCPAKLVCPAIAGAFKAATEADPAKVKEVSDTSLVREYETIKSATFYAKAVEEELFRRLNSGRDLPGVKLVAKQAKRVFKDGAAEKARDAFGDAAFETPELKSPAQVQALPGGAAFVKQWAYTPQTGLTVAPASDSRTAVKVQTAAEALGEAAKAALTDE